jgi:hypothetical protein
MLVTPGTTAPAATATNPAIRAYSIISCPRISLQILMLQISLLILIICSLAPLPTKFDSSPLTSADCSEKINTRVLRAPSALVPRSGRDGLRFPRGHAVGRGGSRIPRAVDRRDGATREPSNFRRGCQRNGGGRAGSGYRAGGREFAGDGTVGFSIHGQSAGQRVWWSCGSGCSTVGTTM